VTGAGRRRLRQRLLIVFLIAMTIPYARQLVSSPTVGQDFRAFFAAATVVAHHGDPYDWPSLARAEDQLYDAPRQLAPGDPAFYEFLAYPEGPWLAFALVPLTGLPWQAADAIYTSLLLLVLVGASFTVFALLGWRPPRAWRPPERSEGASLGAGAGGAGRTGTRRRRRCRGGGSRWRCTSAGSRGR